MTVEKNYVIKGPRTPLKKLQKMQFSSIHPRTFITTATIFSTFSYLGNDFENNFERKTYALCSVLGPSVTDNNTQDFATMITMILGSAGYGMVRF